MYWMRVFLVLLSVAEADCRVQPHTLGRGLGLELRILSDQAGLLRLGHLHHGQRHAGGGQRRGGAKGPELGFNTTLPLK